MKRQIILASQSPRRREIMSREGLNPIICPADVTEVLPEGIAPEDAVMFLSLKKALAIEREHTEFAGSLIIAADTVVYQGRIYGKPHSREEAYEMIESFRNTSHQVMTGVSLLIAGTGARRSFCETTHVFCKDYSQEFIESYIDTPEPYDKAGAYAIQMTFGKYIDHIEGDYDNVVGLPFQRMMAEIDLLEAQSNSGVLK